MPATPRRGRNASGHSRQRRYLLREKADQRAEHQRADMLLRSASSPLLNCARAPAEHLAVLSPSATRQGATLCRATSEGDIAGPLAPAVRGGGKKDDGHGYGQAPPPLSASSSASFSVEEEEGEYEEEDVVTTGASAPVPLRWLLTSTGLDSSPAASALALVEEGGGDGGSNDSHHAAADAHYRSMIGADPANSLLLVNYAKFLKEVEGDAARAQEYCERAILANPADADALSLYAGLVWETTRDADRADDYYTRAVQAAPDDCYVLGSYAGFLWDAEEDDEEESDSTQQLPQPSPFLDAARPPSIAAAS